jgi:hypothetical protein
LAKEYWLRTIQPYVKDRALRGVELYVATDAHLRLRKAQEDAERWSQTIEGQGAPVPAEAFADWNRDEFREPQELCRDEKVTPELLAAIAAPMMQERAGGLTPVAVVGAAHELLRAAQQYVNALPEQKRGEARIMEEVQTALSTVTFAEIEASNKGSSGQLPLLPPVARKKKGKPDEEISEKPLSAAGIKKAVERFISELKPRRTKEDYWAKEKEEHSNPAVARLIANEQWESDNADLVECQKNGRVLLQNLCQLRWERFAEFRETRHRAAMMREHKRQEKRQEKPPSSGASNPKTAAKPEKRQK